MNKIIAIFCLVSALMLSACCHFGHCAEKNILAATFPVYLFTANICANAPDVKVQLLVPAQTGCPHDFAPRPADLQKLAKAGILVINGDGLDSFLTKPLGQMDKKPAIIDAGANAAVFAGDNTGPGEGHLFASPANAAIMARNIGAKLAEIDQANAAIYKANADKYARELEILSEKLIKAGKKAKNPNIAIEHEALACLVSNAGLKVAFIIEDSQSAIALAKMGKELKKAHVAVLAGDEQYSDRLLKTIADETGIPFIMLDPCANGPENPPLDYYQTVMDGNIRVLERFFD